MVDSATRSYHRAYYLAHPEKWHGQSRLWREANREVAREYQRAYQRLYGRTRYGWAMRKALNARRVARRYDVPVSDLTTIQVLRLFGIFDYCCAYCLVQSENLWIDHVIPLSKGGLNTFVNVVPCCQRCNQKKRTGPPPQAKPVQLLLLVSE